MDIKEYKRFDIDLNKEELIELIIEKISERNDFDPSEVDYDDVKILSYENDEGFDSISIEFEIEV